MRILHATIPPVCFKANRWIWYGVLSIALIDALWLWQAGMAVDISREMRMVYLCGLCLATGLFYRYVRHDEKLYLFCQIASQIIIGTWVLGVFSYLTSRCNFPLRDQTLIAFDHALLFDWRQWIDFISTFPTLTRLLSVAYDSCEPQIIVLIVTLFLYGELQHLQRWLVAFLGTGFVVIVLAALFPAVGGYVYYNIDVAGLASFHPAAARIHEHDLLALRDHSMSVLTFPLLGLVTFPSFHSVLAVLAMFASLPVRWLAVVMIPLNMLVLLSTPGDGGHYLVDVLSGIAIALAGIYFFRRFFLGTR